jgi:hypothetical protein
MPKYIELIDKYRIEQSKDTDYNPPSYEWVDNTGEIVRCKDCFLRQHCKVAQYLGEDGFCSNGEKREKS